MSRIIGAAVLALVVVGVFWLFESDIPAEEVDAAYSNQASQFFAHSDGGRVHFRDQGNPQGETIVLLHGSNASLHTWEPWVEILGDTYRVVTLDLPGHGLTGRVPSDDYSMNGYVQVVEALATQLDLSSFVLGGNSMGGGVAWRYALAHGERVRALVLVDGSAPYRNQVEDDQREGPIAFKLLQYGWFRAIARYLDVRPFVEQGVYASHYDPNFVTSELLERYATLNMREGTRAATMARFAQRRSRQDGLDPKNLVQPTLIMWGEEDNLIPVEVARLLHEAMPNSRLVTYPQVGHIPMEEVPQRSAADVVTFLQGLEPDSATILGESQ